MIMKSNNLQELFFQTMHKVSESLHIKFYYCIGFGHSLFKDLVKKLISLVIDSYKF